MGRIARSGRRARQGYEGSLAGQRCRGARSVA